MGLLDAFKKKSQDAAGSSASLNDLPPIPQKPFSDPKEDIKALEDMNVDSTDLPPLPESTQPDIPNSATQNTESSTVSESPGLPALPDPVSNSETTAETNSPSSSSSLPEPKLEVPQPDGFLENPQTTSSEGLTAASSDKKPSDTGLSSGPEAAPSEISSGLEIKVPEPQEVEDQKKPEQPTVESSKPVEKEVEPIDFASDVSSNDIAEPEQTEDTDSHSDHLPDFTDLHEDISQERNGEQMIIDASSSTDITTETLLLKSIFIEKEHYANILFSLKQVKEDLQKSGPQQRKLNHVDMKLAKEYSKMSVLCEHFNENLMIIEQILSNEQF